MTSNTGAKQANKGQFTKGDQRINRKGRPKSFDALRALAQQISHEVLTAQDGTSRTVAEAILRKLATENPERFLEIAFGKVPQPVEISGKDGKAIEFDYGKLIAHSTPRPTGDSDTPGPD